MSFTDHQIATIVVNSVFPALALCFIALRLYAKSIKNARFQLDDYLILLGLVCLLGQSMPFIYAAVKGGMGEHISNLNNHNLIIFGKVTFFTQFAYIFAVAVIKLSILVFYRQVFTIPNFKLATNIMMILILLWTIAFFFATLLQAWPISYNWDSIQPGTTINEMAMYNGLACTELITDVMILLMPLFVVWGLQLKTSKKWAISGIFLLGGFVCVASAFRIYYLTTTVAGVTTDFTYDTYGYFLWTAIEPCMGTICACLPCLTPLFKDRHSTKSLFASSRRLLRLNSSTSASRDYYSANKYGYSTSSTQEKRVVTRCENCQRLMVEKKPSISDIRYGQHYMEKKPSLSDMRYGQTRPVAAVQTTITSMSDRGW